MGIDYSFCGAHILIIMTIQNEEFHLHQPYILEFQLNWSGTHTRTDQNMIGHADVASLLMWLKSRFHHSAQLTLGLLVGRNEISVQLYG